MDVPLMLMSTTSAPRPRGWSSGRTARRGVDVVGPAPAGMFPSRSAPGRFPGRRPRARGDVPRSSACSTYSGLSAPRPRGCSPLRSGETSTAEVGPAPAGMFPGSAGESRRTPRRPRARGDVPSTGLICSTSFGSAPRPRGCSRRADSPDHLSTRRPRARGDAPWQGGYVTAFGASAPRPRGCSARRVLVAAVADVGPAPAGMLPASRPISRCCVGRPRARGDAPRAIARNTPEEMSAPRRRGCSAVVTVLRGLVEVGPAPARTLPGCASSKSAGACRPRARGDAPEDGEGEACVEMSAPRPRGCSYLHGDDVRRQGVGPAPAGMLPSRRSRSWPAPRRPRAHGDAPVDDLDLDLREMSALHQVDASVADQERLVLQVARHQRQPSAHGPLLAHSGRTCTRNRAEAARDHCATPRQCDRQLHHQPPWKPS
ncbi:hypothetical protein SAMN05421833_12928 [Microbispora rosea]|uniref:Uncharacterized protein n=1 Tax=Microbispora rosea TaxID=58117 RepID=A0A1N7GHU8_9ACTN|nr:hypothetical protein SAMN05421833_12928 [Microbispora rosea]